MKTQLLKKLFVPIAITIMMAFFFSANAQIVYTDVNPDFVGSTNGAAYYLDLNNDGINDFTIAMWQSTHVSSCGSIAIPVTSTTISIVTADSNSVLVVDTVASFPESFSSNQVIDSSELWAPGSLLLTSRIPSCVYSQYFGRWFLVYDNKGHWNSQLNKYLGLRVLSHGDYYYGWVKLDVYNEGASASSFTVKEYACNSKPQQSVLTGQYDCIAPTAVVTADGPLSYCSWDSIDVTLTATSDADQCQWLKDGADIPGATDFTYTANAVGNFKARVTSPCSSAVSQGITIDKITFTNSVSVNGGTLTANVAQSTYQWIDCATMQPIEGATGKSYTPSRSGSYCVQITFKGCTDTSACYKVVTTGIPENNYPKSTSVYPNPASYKITLSFSSHGKKQIQIANIVGQIVFAGEINSTKEEIDVSHFPSGIYLLQWNDNKSIQSKTFSVER